MSGARTEVFTPEGELIGFGHYRGSSDTVAPRVVPDMDSEDWWDRAQGGWGESAACSHVGEPCLVWSDYAGGFYWPATVCRECMVLTDGVSPYEPDYGYSIPPAAEVEKWRRWRAEGWPRDGHPFPRAST